LHVPSNVPSNVTVSRTLVVPVAHTLLPGRDSTLRHWTLYDDFER